MAAPEAFVDVTYRGFELGKRLKISLFGPTTAYLEHPAPLPVGTRLEIAIDPGETIVATVLRVCEQVTGAERAPGMHIRAADLAGAAASWWGEHVTSGDPQIPERYAPPPPPAPPPGDDGAVEQPISDLTERQEIAAADATPPTTTAVMEAVKQDELRRQTSVMSTDEIREAIGQDPELADLADLAEEPELESDPGIDDKSSDAGGNGDPRTAQGKRRGKARAQRKRKR